MKPNVCVVSVCCFGVLFNSTSNALQVSVVDAFETSFLGFACIEGVDVI